MEFGLDSAPLNLVAESTALGSGPGAESSGLLQEQRMRVQQNNALLTYASRAALPPLDVYSGANKLFTPRSASRWAETNIIQPGKEKRNRKGQKKKTVPIAGPGSILNAEYTQEGEEKKPSHPMYI
jgi:hypothetical protein